MKTTATNVQHCLTIEMQRNHDDRGFFQEIYTHRLAYQMPMFHSATKGYVNWQQVNWSNSNKNVVRGIHAAPYCKLISCISGKIKDVVVDLRPNSPTFLKHFSVILSPDNPISVFVPHNCGHAFVSLESNSTIIYLQSDTYSSDKESTVRWNDPTLNIDWFIDDPILSEKDKNALTLKEIGLQ